MQVLTFDTRQYNSFSIGEARYFLLMREGRLSVLRNECPHRGGPLSLGKLSPCKLKLVCPWHDGEFAIRQIEHHGLPSIRQRDKISVVAAKGSTRLWNEMLPANRPCDTHGETV
jgi:nitrite reductase (NADH) small subunit